MPWYSFRCEQHGDYDAFMLMREVRATWPCPTCRRPSRRVYVAPLLNLGDASARRLLDATAATASAPPVVTAVPGRPRRRQKVARDPRLAKLPKPD